MALYAVFVASELKVIDTKVHRHYLRSTIIAKEMRKLFQEDSKPSRRGNTPSPSETMPAGRT